MVSVIVPSRQRAKLLRKSLESLGSTNMEVLVWVDDDDPQLQEYASLPVQLFIRPRVGYENFYRMVNYLAKQSTGEWLLLWNDDMQLNNGSLPSFDRYNFMLPQVLNFWNPGNSKDNLAPVISRSMYDIMGHFSLNTHCDSWVQDIANELGIHRPIHGVNVVHLREVLDDETKKHSQSVYSTSSPSYDSFGMQRLRQKDIKKIRAAL